MRSYELCEFRYSHSRSLRIGGKITHLRAADFEMRVANNKVVFIWKLIKNDIIK